MVGRPRKQGKRWPSGGLCPPSERLEDNATTEILHRRACLVGGFNKALPEAGTAIGVLFLRNLITREEYNAGLAFLKAYLAYRSMIGASALALTNVEGGGNRPDPTESRWDRVKEAYIGARDALTGEEVDAIWPLVMEDKATGDLGDVQVGLAKLAAWFRSARG